MQKIRLRPTVTDSTDNDINLFFSEHAASALRKSRHRRSGNSIRGRVTYNRVVCDRQVHGITECDCSTAFSFWSVATGTVLPVQDVEI
jgi:hypothetical protein